MLKNSPLLYAVCFVCLLSYVSIVGASVREFPNCSTLQIFLFFCSIIGTRWLPAVVQAVRNYDAKNRAVVRISVTIVKLRGILTRLATQREPNVPLICDRQHLVEILKLVRTISSILNTPKKSSGELKIRISTSFWNQTSAAFMGFLN